MILALKHFEIYVKSATHQVIVYTDHNPLVFINRMKQTNQRVLRWSLLLQEYPITIKHIPGSSNIMALGVIRTLTFHSEKVTHH